MRLLFLTLACLAAVSLLAGQPAQAPSPPSDSPRAGSNASPFSVGERLSYQIVWDPPWYLFFLPTMHAGEAELRIAGETQHNGRKALRIVFVVRSSGTFVKLVGITVDDHFEFLTDPNSLCTFSVTKKEREGKRKRDIQVTYYSESRRLHFREVDVAAVPPKVKRDEFIEDVPECVKDLFSALYFVRRSELKTGSVHRSIVGDNARIREIAARVEASDVVETPAGKYEAWRLNTIAVLGGLFKEGGQFKIWLTTDERKLPVQFEAKASVGKVIGKLKLVEP